MVFRISSGSVVMSPFSFLILLIRILSLCPLVSLAKGLSILLIFPKNQLLVWLILWIVLLVSTWVISPLSLIISCLLLLLCEFASFSSRPFRCVVKLKSSVLYLVSFWRHSELWVFFLAQLSLYPLSLGMLCLYFNWILKSLTFLSLFHPWPSYHWVEHCSAFMCMWTFCCFCCYWRPVLVFGDLLEYKGLFKSSCICFVTDFMVNFEKVTQGD